MKKELHEFSRDIGEGHRHRHHRGRRPDHQPHRPTVQSQDSGEDRHHQTGQSGARPGGQEDEHSQHQKRCRRRA